MTRKRTPAQHVAQAPIRKAKAAANQRRADARLNKLLDAISVWLGPIEVIFDGEKPGVSGYLAIREHRFLPPRKWKFDLAFPACKVAIEIDGGRWHVTGRDMNREAERNNEAQILGWKVLHFTSDMIDSDLQGCVDVVKRAASPQTATPDETAAKLTERILADMRAKNLPLLPARQTPISGSAARRFHA